MTTQQQAAADAAPDITKNADDTQLWVERTGVREYVGRSSRGGEVRLADISQPGAFTPGELLKIALAACSGFATDQAVRRRLGDDAAVTVRVSGLADEASDRYPAIAETFEVDLSGLEPAERDRLLTVLHRAIDEHCTVGNTLKAGADVQLTIAGER
jgi:uncharacterized OsmC-like protein